MKRFHLKHLLQRIAVRTQFPPFTWLYRAIYALAVRLCVRRLRRINGVRAVYLRRGLAAGQPLYGLSDIDLLVMVEEEQSGRAKARARYQYELLRRVIPMLAKDELALYSPRQFRVLYEHSPFYRNRFNQGRREWRRLFGDDLFKDLPPVCDGARLLAPQELGPAWYHLAQELLPGDGRPSYLRRYMAYKSIAEAARAALVAQGGDLGIPRETALVRASDKYTEVSEALKDVRSWRGNLLCRERIPTDRLMNTYLYLARKALSTKTDPARLKRRLHVLSVPPAEIGMLLNEDAFREIQEARAGLDGIERAVFVPRLSFNAVAVLGMDPAAQAGATVDAFDLVLIGKCLPQVEKLREFNLVLDRFHPVVNAFFSDGKVAVSLQPMAGRNVKDPDSDPEFFACLSSGRPLDGGLEIGGAVEVDRAFERADALEHRAQTLLALFGEGEAFRMPVKSFLALFWETGRAAWLAAQGRESAVEVPVSSTQVVDALAGLTASAEPVLRHLHREYCKEMRGRPSDAVRYMNWAAQYARKLEDLLFSSEPGSVELPAQARTELSVSVIIVTRNRAELLRRALGSLVEQERQADQVVVVDNASSDDTPSVVRSFADKLNLTLVREKTVGISHARNAALRCCRGDIVASLDDDCVADRRWLAELEIPFLKDPRIGAVGGSIMPADRSDELIARFYRTRMRHAQDKEETIDIDYTDSR